MPRAAAIEVAKRKGIYKGRKTGMGKAKKGEAAENCERAKALGMKKRTVQRYLKADPATMPLLQN